MSAYIRAVPNSLAGAGGGGGGGGGSPAGPQGALQWNNAGSFQGTSAIVTNGIGSLALTGPITSTFNSGTVFSFAAGQILGTSFGNITCVSLSLTQVGLPTLASTSAEFYLISGSGSAISLGASSVHTAWVDNANCALWGADYNFNASQNLVLRGRNAIIPRYMLNASFSTITDNGNINTVPVPTHLLTLASTTNAKPILNIKGPASTPGDYLDVSSFSSTGDIFRIDSSGHIFSPQTLGNVVANPVALMINSATGQIGVFTGASTVNTTDGTATTIMTIPMTTNTSLCIQVSIIGRCTGGSSGVVGNTVAGILTQGARNVSGGVNRNGAFVPALDDSGGTWIAQGVASSPNLLIAVQGAANVNLTWTALVTTTLVG